MSSPILGHEFVHSVLPSQSAQGMHLLSLIKNPALQEHTVFWFSLQETRTVPLRQGLQFMHWKRVLLEYFRYCSFLQPHTVSRSTVQEEISTWFISFRHIEQLRHCLR